MDFYLTGTSYRLFQLSMSLNSSKFLNEENTQGPKRNRECLESLESQTPSSFQDNPLQQLQLASHKVLEKAQKSGRSKCPRCNSSRMFYCYTCFVPVETVPTKEIPTVKVNISYASFLIFLCLLVTRDGEQTVPDYFFSDSIFMNSNL